MEQIITRETASLLLEFNTVGAENKSPFWEKWDEKIQTIRQEMSESSGNWQTDHNREEYWRFNNSLTNDLYLFLQENYPVPIPYVLFFSYTELDDVKNIKWIGDLADKWLMDIFSRESFYKRNKEYFTRAEVKHFLVCDWVKSDGTNRKMCKYSDLAYHFFNAIITANNMELSSSTLMEVSKYFFAHSRILKEFLVFIRNNKNFIKDEEIRSISYFLNREYIENEKDFDFKKQTYKSLKWLTDIWYATCYLEERNYRFGAIKDSKIVQDYIQFICKNLIRENIKRFSHNEITDFGHYFRLMEYSTSDHSDDLVYYWGDDRDDDWDYEGFSVEHDSLPLFVGNDFNDINDIFDFLRIEYFNNGIDFDFNNYTWRSLKQLSNEWHYENELVQIDLDGLEFQKLLDINWKKSQINDFTYEKNGIIWTITEITSGKLLHEEGQIMGNCCFYYLKDCINRDCMIFSVKRNDKKCEYEERIATVEISNRWEITQARGKFNSDIDEKTENIIILWADKNQIDWRNF